MTGDENMEITTETKFLTTVQGHLIHYSQMALKCTRPRSNQQLCCKKEISYTKQQLGGAKLFEKKILGVPWNREQDAIGVILQILQTETTKRDVLSHLAKIHDPLGNTSNTYQETALS